jgi:hypothetical protein
VSRTRLKIGRISPYHLWVEVQIIASVLSSMQVYWSSIFILPKPIIKEIVALRRDETGKRKSEMGRGLSTKV